MSKIVIALGGNALGNSANEQLTKAELAAKSIADLITAGHHVVIAHGNGPQVGKIRLAFEETSQKPEDIDAVSRMYGHESRLYRLSPAAGH